MSMEYKLPFTAKEVEEVLVKGKEVLPNIEQYKGLEYVGSFTVGMWPFYDNVESESFCEVDSNTLELLSIARFAEIDLLSVDDGEKVKGIVNVGFMEDWYNNRTAYHKAFDVIGFSGSGSGGEEYGADGSLLYVNPDLIELLISEIGDSGDVTFKLYR